MSTVLSDSIHCAARDNQD